MKLIQLVVCLIICTGGSLHCRAEDFSTTNREALGHFWKAAEEKTRPVTVLSFGDSMADSYRSPTYFLIKKLAARLGPVGYSLVNYENKLLYQLFGNTAYLAPSQIWFSTYFSIPPASGVWWENQVAAGGIRCDEAGIFYVRHPQGGLFTLSVSTNTGPWATNLVLDGYSPTPIGCFTNLTLPLNHYRLRVDGINGTNYVIGPSFLQAHTNGLHIAFADYPGIALSHVTNVPAAIREPIFAALKPDLLVWHMKESIDPLRGGLEACEAWWTNAYPDCDVLYIGTPFAVDNTNTLTADQNRIVRQVALQYNRAYVDLMQPGISFDWLTTNGLLSADGVHLTSAGGHWGSEIMWKDMNLFAVGLPRSLSLQPTGGLMRVTFPTAVGAIYGLQSSTNLQDWSSIMTVTGNGIMQATNLSPSSGSEFYRLNLTPN